MKTKSIRAIIKDAEKIEQLSRILSVELHKRITVSQIVHELMEYLENAKKAIEEKDAKIS